MANGGRHYAGLLLAAVLAGSSGCVCLSHTTATVPPDCVTTCEAVPSSCRGKVYVVLLDGFDPCGLCRAAEVRNCLIAAGFPKVFHGQCYHAPCFAREVCDLYAEEPDARFVVVGFSSGVCSAVHLAETVGHAGVPIDLLIAVDAPAWSKAVQNVPHNVHRTICTRGTIQLPDCLQGDHDEVVCSTDGADEDDGRPLTVERLVTELAALAGTIPVIGALPAAELGGSDQAPRSPSARSEVRHDEWDFLKPLFRLADAPRESDNGITVGQTMSRSAQAAPKE